MLAGILPATADPLVVGGSVLEPVDPHTLAGFPGPDPAGALGHFRAVCRSGKDQPLSGQAAQFQRDLSWVCAQAETVGADGAAAFFADRFDAYRVVRPAGDTEPARRTGFLTGYFEPELEGSYEQGAAYRTPVLARPDDLVSLDPGEARPGLAPGLRAARQVGDRLEPYPDRAAIEQGALGERARPLIYLRDPVDLFVLQVQGSGRVRLPDGSSVRVLYDGRNGQPYTSVAKLIVGEGHLPLEGLTLARWTGWLREHPQEATRLMRANASYIFFRLEPMADPASGPLGAAKVPLVAGTSMAVDATLWPYGTPFWLEAPAQGQTSTQAGRLVVAADTGSAIVGAARGDLFVGTGAQAGVVAGNLRDAVGFVVLLPKPSPAP